MLGGWANLSSIFQLVLSIFQLVLQVFNRWVYLLKTASTALAKSDSAGPSGPTSLAAALAAPFP
jgi:hypothetical protein